MSIFGFDFGTTNSLIARIEGDRCVLALDERGLPHPSVLCYEGDQVLVGREARERMVDSRIGVSGNIVRSPKTLLGRHSVHVEGVARSPREMVGEIVRHVAEHASQLHPGDYQRAVVTIPVDMNGERRRDLREAFRLAGVAIDQFVHEPLAALYGYLRSQADYRSELRRLDRQYMLVFDWGGGTLDLTLCQLVDGMLVQIRNDGCSHIGGDVLDETIRNEVVRRVIAGRGIQQELEPVSGAAARLLARAERAKIELSSRESYRIYVPNYFYGLDDPDIEHTLTRAELDHMVGDKIQSGITRVNDLLSAAGLAPADIALCLATGGMVNMPLIKTRLYEIFGSQRVRVSERGQTIIAEGAAWIAHDRANLCLSKNIEVALARGALHPVIRAGLEMPRQGMATDSIRLQLYCTDPRDGVAKIQLETPIRHGRHVQKTDLRDSLALLSVAVDSQAKELFERVDMGLTIDENLILTVEARSALREDTNRQEIHTLEFGLQVGSDQARRKPEGETEKQAAQGSGKQPAATGQVMLRANLALHQDMALIPGDYLRVVRPRALARDSNPTEQQIREDLYYKPCSLCGRRSNDPLCRCGSKLPPNIQSNSFERH